MHTTDLSAVALPKADVPLSAEERLQEVAAILAGGLLRLRTRPQLAATSALLTNSTRIVVDRGG